MDGEYATYHGDDGEINVIVGEHTTAEVNFVGTDIFDDSVDVFSILHDLQVALENNDSEGISNQIEPLGDALEQVVNVRADAGARMHRLEVTENYWANFLLNVTENLSKTEDADLAKTITDLTSQEAVYEASLAASARIIQPTLIDFLR
jgi:flagellar hook-associated protein 3 FlgL